MHDEIRTGPPYGDALCIPYRAAPKSLSRRGRPCRWRRRLSRRQDERSECEGGGSPGLCPVEGALEPRHLPGQSTTRPGGEWTVRMEGSRIVFPALEKRSCEVGMQSEPGWPRIIHGDTPPKAKQREECPHIRGRPAKRAPQIAIPSCGPAGLHVYPKTSLSHATDRRCLPCHIKPARF
jgi:hypothetical protein